MVLIISLAAKEDQDFNIGVVRKVPIWGQESAIVEHLEARLAVVKEAAVASDKYNESTVLCLRLASLQSLYSCLHRFPLLILRQPVSGPPGIALPSKKLPLQCLDLCQSPSLSFLHSPAHQED